jgi:hypothetical protein
MASFPGAKVKRPNRRKLSRGQHTQFSSANATPSAATVTVTIAFDRPVIVSGNIDLGLLGVDLVSQVQNDNVTVTQVYSATVVGLDWTIEDNDPVIKTTQGGGVNGDSGTF